MNYLEVLFDQTTLGALEDYFNEGQKEWFRELEMNPFANNNWFEDDGIDTVLLLYPDMSPELLDCIRKDLEYYFI